MSLRRFEHGAVTAELHETAFVVACRMRDFHVGSVVITRGARPIGIVTDRDLVLRVLADGRDPRATCVADFVTYDATTLPSEASIETAARTMRDHGVRRLPIVTSDGRISGVVTADDLTALLASELADVGETLASAVDATDSR
ncbi:MAG TPA: CBS domain-containing protein [Minicystis sp.]|nr:CBS domain-containing protein [Minicystis sp.]